MNSFYMRDMFYKKAQRAKPCIDGKKMQQGNKATHHSSM